LQVATELSSVHTDNGLRNHSDNIYSTLCSKCAYNKNPTTHILVALVLALI